MKKNILVFPCGSEIGLDIYQQVKYSTYFHLIGGNSTDDHGKYTYDDYIGNIPFVGEADFLPILKKIISSRKIDAIYPTMDSVIAYLKYNESILGCKIIAAPALTNNICLSKELTYRKLKNVIQIPALYNINDSFNYPVFVKPKIGYGARGAKIIHNDKELLAIENLNSHLILEYLPGEEYTVDCFTNRHGILLFCAARTRSRIRMGISVNTSFVEDQEEFVELAKAINKKLRFRGAWFFQIKRNKTGQAVLLEVATRFGGSSLICTAVGVNFPLLTLFDAFDYDVKIIPNKHHAILERSFSTKCIIDIKYSTVYVDFDDCILLNNNQINTKLVTFLYNCVNKGIKLILLTKHQGDLQQKLQQFRLYYIFDEIIHIKPEEEKYSYIKETEAIFIDDSFAEREKIYKHTGTTVFSPETIEFFL